MSRPAMAAALHGPCHCFKALAHTATDPEEGDGRFPVTDLFNLCCRLQDIVEGEPRDGEYKALDVLPLTSISTSSYRRPLRFLVIGHSCVATDTQTLYPSHCQPNILR